LTIASAGIYMASGRTIDLPEGDGRTTYGHPLVNFSSRDINKFSKLIRKICRQWKEMPKDNSGQNYTKRSCCPKRYKG
jgi:hypothetical protein